MSEILKEAAVVEARDLERTHLSSCSKAPAPCLCTINRRKILIDALTRMAAENEKLEGELNRTVYSLDKARQERDRAEHEASAWAGKAESSESFLSESRAESARLREAAQKLMDAWTGTSKEAAYADVLNGLHEALATPSSAKEWLEGVRKEAKADGLDEAAKFCDGEKYAYNIHPTGAYTCERLGKRLQEKARALRGQEKP